MSSEANSRFIRISGLVLAGWSVLVLVLLLRPGSFYHGHFFFKGEDHLYHYLLFTVWSFLTFVLGFRTTSPIRSVLFISLLIGALFSVGTEILQQWIPDRTSELLDLIADLAGILTGLVISLTLKKGVDRLANKFES